MDTNKINKEKYTYLVDPRLHGQIVVDLLNERGSWKVEKGYPKSSYKSFYPRMLNNEWNLLWKPNIKIKQIASLEDKTPETVYDIPLPFKTQIINRFRNTSLINRKDNLIYTLDAYYSKLGQNIFDVIPETFIVNSYTKDRYLRILSRMKKGTILIVKPENDNGGRGIHLVDNYEDLSKLTNEKKYGNLIVQRYITNPLLIRTPYLSSDAREEMLAPARKFDVRVNVLVDNDFKIYTYQEAMARMSSEAYVPKLTKNEDMNNFIHITNGTLQKITNYMVSMKKIIFAL